MPYTLKQELEYGYDTLKDMSKTLTNFNEELADDVLHIAIEKALINEEVYIPGDSFFCWMYSIMRNVLFNIYRENSRKLDEQWLKDTYVIKSYVQPQDCLHESVEQLGSCIDELSDTYKVVIDLSLDGYKYAEIANILNIPVGTVRRRMFVAREKLKKENGDE